MDSSAAAGVAGEYAGAGAEGSLHGASTGADTLPARQTTIAWPVTGGEDYGTLRMPRCGARTGRAALGHPARPPGADATSPGTSGPPVQADARACVSGRVPVEDLPQEGLPDKEREACTGLEAEQAPEAAVWGSGGDRAAEEEEGGSEDVRYQEEDREEV